MQRRDFIKSVVALGGASVLGQKTSFAFQDPSYTPKRSNPATRLPESLWLTFNPIVSDPRGWMLDKSGEQVSPFDVVRGGSRQMHAVTSHFSYKDDKGSFFVEPIDSPLVAMGKKSPLNFSKEQPDLSSGIHVNLFNNAWGTNYIMWYGEDMRSRFILRA